VITKECQKYSKISDLFFGYPYEIKWVCPSWLFQSDKEIICGMFAHVCTTTHLGEKEATALEWSGRSWRVYLMNSHKSYESVSGYRFSSGWTYIRLQNMWCATICLAHLISVQPLPFFYVLCSVEFRNRSRTVSLLLLLHPSIFVNLYNTSC